MLFRAEHWSATQGQIVIALLSAFGQRREHQQLLALVVKTSVQINSDGGDFQRLRSHYPENKEGVHGIL